jgi:hypothetical protein
MTAKDVQQRMQSGQPLHAIEDEADWLDNFQWLSHLPAVQDDQGEALFIVPITEVSR